MPPRSNAPASSSKPPPPNLDDPTSDEESDREPTPPPKPKPKPKVKVQRRAFNAQCMTIIDGVVYQDRTRDRGLPLDPFIFLREPELQQLITLLIDPKALETYLDKKFSRVMKLIEYATLFLVSYFFFSFRATRSDVFQEKHHEVWPLERGWDAELARLHYPLRRIYNEIESDHQPYFERFKNVLLKKSKKLEVRFFSPS